MSTTLVMIAKRSRGDQTKRMTGRTAGDADGALVPELLAALVGAGLDLVQRLDAARLAVVDESARVPVEQLHRDHEVLGTDLVSARAVAREHVENLVVPLLRPLLQHPHPHPHPRR